MAAPNRIVLIGYRGTGKSSVGPILAARLEWEFIDADEWIEAVAGRPIAGIFASEGESGFRDRESRTLVELCSAAHRVIATGGGAVQRAANRDLIRGAGFVAWLTATPETAWARMRADPTTAARRPSLATGGLEEVVNLMAARAPLYRMTAHAEFSTEGRSPQDVAADILAACKSSCNCR
jgi:shikimate kinase